MERTAPNLEQVQSKRTDIGGNFPLDEAVVEALPPDVKIISANYHGSSAWSVTGSIDAKTSDGNPISFFVKYTTEETGREQLEGEYKGMLEIYNTVSGLAPKPYGYGKLKYASRSTYFFVCEFVDIIRDALPDPVKLGARLAELHQTSISPTGKFGFHVPTYDGKLPQITDWESSWSTFFARLLAGIARLDTATNGPWPELDAAIERTLTSVIPRLLGALESDGRAIKPCLIHGDLWEGNTGTECETGNIYIFDGAPYYAHNEMELGIWRTEHHRMKNKAYKREYLKNFEPSEPRDEFDDRNRLYSVKTQLMYSAHVRGSNVRNQAYGNLIYLIEKYASPLDDEDTDRATGAAEALRNPLEKSQILRDGLAHLAIGDNPPPYSVVDTSPQLAAGSSMI